jgi:hypothetical protein
MGKPRDIPRSRGTTALGSAPPVPARPAPRSRVGGNNRAASRSRWSPRPPAAARPGLNVSTAFKPPLGGGQCRLRHSAGHDGLTGRSLFRTDHRRDFRSISSRPAPIINLFKRRPMRPRIQRISTAFRPLQSFFTMPCTICEKRSYCTRCADGANCADSSSGAAIRSSQRPFSGRFEAADVHLS